MALTKQDINAIKEVMSQELDIKLSLRLLPIENKIDNLQQDISGLREQIQQLTITLDNFVKIMTDYKEEFTILKAEVDQMKRIFKEKFGVDIAVQR
ncbi:MAG: hypothetical protein AAB795_04365 [Patescibacteria group bacterium]